MRKPELLILQDGYLTATIKRNDVEPPLLPLGVLTPDQELLRRKEHKSDKNFGQEPLYPPGINPETCLDCD